MEQTEELREIVAQGLIDYQEAYDADHEQRSFSMDDVNFTYSEDGQWDELATKRRQGKPRYTVNLVAAAVNEIIGN